MGAFTPAPVVYVVDSDTEVLYTVQTLGLETVTYTSAEAFFSAYHPSRSGCLITDLCMPGRNGYDFLGELEKCGVVWPIILLTTPELAPLAGRAVQAGAFNYFVKSFDPQDLLECVNAAFHLEAMRKTSLRREECPAPV